MSTGITDADRAAYRKRVDEGGCQVWSCGGQGDPGFSVWWKCPDGHREEFRYCGRHGPEMLEAAIIGRALIKCACGGWMTPLVEGLGHGP